MSHNNYNSSPHEASPNHYAGQNHFYAFRIHNREGKIRPQLETITLDDLTPGEVVIKVAYSGINYKDALAATGAGKIARRFPLVGGIDVAGLVDSSSDPRFEVGDAVLVAGSRLSEDYDGGFAEYARVRADSVVPLPEGLTLWEAMALGTAGFTAGIAIDAMQKNDQHPEHGPILVSGATGGVGSIAIDILDSLGFSVTALTGKRDAEGFLRQIGAADILPRGELDPGKQHLEKALWGGAIDNLGGETLSWLTRTTRPWGNIAAVGLAQGIGLSTSVMPFILRGINLLGINSVDIRKVHRERIWRRMGSDLKPHHLQDIVTRTVSLNDLPDLFERYLRAEITGRTVVVMGKKP
uniref:NADPH2:quinone reductase n=1 Tax=Candidatus Kentrum sp. FM TaxID=2126340 RepID=A0A450SUX6_9GAMM|nr:MAG: NADPH2:quinone reductase [Candidatus Kentron sp. FM]VFJ63417.1 MAG: NADPH2:quinone reductase [Candidatus Kentron sp. FM]VFK14771.1 MAG: NADPH2:quinone reductase [Candidatus Kentron sp. FM]